MVFLKSDLLMMIFDGDVDDYYDYNDDDIVNLGERLKFLKFFFLCYFI